MKLGLDHIQLAIPRGQEPAARAFWGDLIGLTELEKPAPLKARGGCWFQLTGAELHLDVEDPFSPAEKAHPGFQMQDLDHLAAALSAANHPIKTRHQSDGPKTVLHHRPFWQQVEVH